MSPSRRRRPRIAIVGAGMSGILMGMKLKAAGIDTFTIYEKADGVGGTWRDNTYPGLICDVPADLYSYVDRPNPDWSNRFARGPEIQGYLEQAAGEADLGRFMRFGNEVTGATFRDGQWHVETARGERMSADVLIAACGFLRHPRYPEIAGLERFAGSMFHSARWDHGVDLGGARVGILGTGSTGTQIVPAIVETAAKLSVFQRTPQWLLPFPDREYFAFEKACARRFPILSRLAQRAFSLMFEWTFARAVIGNRFLQGCFQFLCQRNLNWNVKDRALRARLQPDYRAGCKRLLFSSAFYPAIQQPNAELVDAPIERVEPGGVVTADGRLHPLDVLILATGFRAHDYMQPMRLVGAGGLRLEQAWKDGVQAYRTIAMPGFPNFFMLIGPGSPVGNFSLIPIAEAQADYIMQVLRRIADGEIAALQPSRAATIRFNEEFRRAAAGTVWLTGCRSWYLDRNGLPDVWPWTIAKFRSDLRRPDLADYEITGAAPAR